MELDYQVYEQDYQGPLEGLLDVARSSDVALSQVNLAELISDFVNYLENRNNWEVGETSTVLLIFSELMRIKTRELLPRKELEEEELGEESNSAEEKGKEFFVQVGEELRNRAKQRSKLYDTSPDLPEFVRKGETVYKEVTLFELIKAFQDVIVTRQKGAELPDFQFSDEFDTEEQMEKIISLITPETPKPFEELLSQSPTREEIVVTFVSLLQLVKSGDLRIVKQVENDKIYVINNT